MSVYRVIDDFQANNSRVIAVDRSCLEDIGKDIYIDGKRYDYIPNSVRQWIQLPGVHESFEGKTVEFK